MADTIEETIRNGLETVDAFDWYFQVLVCIGVSALVIYSLRRFVLRKIAESFNDTEAGWDNDLYIALESKVNIFFLIISIHLSLLWVSPEILVTVFPFLNSTYILLLAIMLSTTVKIATPPLMALRNRNKKGGVSVTGGNHFISIIVRILIWLIGIYAILSELQIEITGILASFALLSLIIGLSMQHTIANILNSFMLAMDSPFDVGDRIEVDGTEGRVVSTGILSTKLLTFSEELVVIPNNTLVHSKIRNMARGGGDGQPRRINLLIDVGVAYGEEPPHVKQVLMDVVKECPYTVVDPAPRVMLNNLSEYSIDFRIFAWIDNYSDQWPARDWILQRVFQRFGEEGIHIPFPTSIELREQSTSGSEAAKKRKRARQNSARIQMSKDEKLYLEERDSLKAYVEELEKQVSDTTLSSRVRDRIRTEISQINKTLERFDAED
jgi:small-conductance mechanosensitive channel